MAQNISDDVRKLVAYIEENLKASSSAGLTFIDTRNLKGRLMVQAESCRVRSPGSRKE
jgi:hypothetical protein